MKSSARGRQAPGVYSIIKRKIITLEYRPGEVLRERVLESELRVGRTPIREAILTLKAENLVDGSPNEPAYVKDITLKGVKDFFAPFSAIEKLTARLAAQRITAEALADIRRVHEAVLEATAHRDYWNIMAENRKLHTLVALASDNEYLISIHENLRDKAERLAYLAISEELKNIEPLEEHHRKMCDEHSEIIDSLEKHNGNRSEMLAENHVRLFQYRIMMYLSSAST